MGPPQDLKKRWDGEHALEEIEEGFWVTNVEQEEDVDVAENEVSGDRKVVETSSIVHLVSQETIWSALFVLAEKAPVNVDIPDEAISSLKELAKHEEPEKPVSIILDPSARRASQEVEDRRGNQAGEVLHSVPELDRKLPVTVVVFAEALHHPPPVRQKRHRPEETICNRTLIIQLDWSSINEMLILVVALDD